MKPFKLARKGRTIVTMSQPPAANAGDTILAVPKYVGGVGEHLTSKLSEAERQRAVSLANAGMRKRRPKTKEIPWSGVLPVQAGNRTGPTAVLKKNAFGVDESLSKFLITAKNGEKDSHRRDAKGHFAHIDSRNTAIAGGALALAGGAVAAKFGGAKALKAVRTSKIMPKPWRLKPKQSKLKSYGPGIAALALTPMAMHISSQLPDVFQGVKAAKEFPKKDIVAAAAQKLLIPPMPKTVKARSEYTVKTVVNGKKLNKISQEQAKEIAENYKDSSKIPLSVPVHQLVDSWIGGSGKFKYASGIPPEYLGYFKTATTKPKTLLTEGEIREPLKFSLKPILKSTFSLNYKRLLDLQAEEIVKAQAKVLRDLVNNSPRTKKTIHRGIRLHEDHEVRLKEGDTFYSPLSSWTNREESAEYFSGKVFDEVKWLKDRERNRRESIEIISSTQRFVDQTKLEIARIKKRIKEDDVRSIKDNLEQYLSDLEDELLKKEKDLDGYQQSMIGWDERSIKSLKENRSKFILHLVPGAKAFEIGSSKSLNNEDELIHYGNLRVIKVEGQHITVEPVDNIDANHESFLHMLGDT